MRQLFCLLIWALVVLLPHPAFSQTALTILHTSEHHGTVLPLEIGPYAGSGGVVRRATLISTIRQEVDHVLVVDSGDLLIGSAISAIFRGAADIAAMNLMGYDALALGNHDFDFGLEHVMRLKQQAKFPFLCTNVRPRRADVCQRFALTSIGPIRVALIGLIGKGNFPDAFNRAVLRDLDFQDPIEAARATISELRERAEVIVAITHQDTEEDLALARSLPALDVIIGGHTQGFDGLIAPDHTAPAVGRIELAGGGPIFVKTHRQGRTLGRLDLLYHDRTIMVAEARNVPVDAETRPDPAVSQLVEHYVRRMNEETGRAIGRLDADLEGEGFAIRTRETNLGNVLADLARHHTGAAVALINAGTIRSSLPSGVVTYRQLMEVLPFDSSLSLLTLTATQLRTALENSVSRLPQANGRFLQVSGLRYAVDPSAPVGKRVRDVQINDVPLDSTRDLTVAVTRFIAEGGDGYGVFLEASGRQDFDVPLRDLLAEALTGGLVLSGQPPRITAIHSR